MTGLEPSDLTRALPPLLNSSLTELKHGSRARACELASEALQELDASEHRNLFAAHYFILQARQGQDDSTAVRHGLQLLTLAEAMNRNEYRSLAHSEIGELYRQLGMHERANRHLRESLRYASTEDSAQMAMPFLRIGLSYLDVAQPAEALVRLERARNLFFLLNHLPLAASALLAEAKALIRLGKPAQALERLETAESLILRTDERHDLTSVHRAMANAYTALGEHDHAEESLSLALTLHEQGVDKDAAGLTELEMAEFNFERGELSAALANLRAALHLFKAAGDMADEAKVLRLMASVHEATGEHEAALGALKEHLRLRQELETQEGDRVASVRIMQLEQSLAHEHNSARRTHKALVEANRVLREQSTRLEELSRTDHLTGLFNRRYLTQLLERDFQMDQHYRPLTLLLLDVDDFKRINDTFGHAVGDKVLVKLAEILQLGGGDGAAVARWGGEEFAIALLDADLKQGAQIAENLRVRLEQHDWNELAPGLKVSLSAGVAGRSNDRLTTLRDLIRLADNRLYLAKAEGRNRVIAAG